MTTTLLSRSLGEIELLVIGAQAPSDADWNAHCDRIRAAIASHTLASLVAVVSDGGAPDAKQRKQFLDILLTTSRRPARIAVCTSSIVARGVMTAFSWFGLQGLRAFPFENLAQGYTWLAPQRIALAEFESIVDDVQRKHGWRSHRRAR